MTDVRGEIQFDHYDEAFAADPYPVLADLRERCPVAHSDAHGGFWVATRYADIQDLCSRPDAFSSRYSSVPNDIGFGDVVIPPLQLDPPEHTRFKKLLTPVFAVGQVGPFEPAARTYVADLLDGLVGKGGFDASHDFARLVPTAVLCQILGVPDDVELLSSLVESILANAATDPDGAAESGMILLAHVAGIVEQRKAEPGPDVLSHLLASEVDGEKLSDEEVIFVGILLVLAGIDTTWSTLSLAIHHLATHPDDQARLRAEPELLGTAMEELLRAFAPVTVARQVIDDLDFLGQPLKQGEMVLVSFPSANRDAVAFDRPDEVVLDRPNNRHLAFGSGIHRCLGIHFARMELRVGLEELLARVPAFELDPDVPVTWARGQVRRPTAVPLRFTA
ncbi:MAG: cytochrome P450 [Actinomycetota bacterium]|nr:cytochrome P450 [Acidimicrobiia bacterium]MDQ3292859.1 cytochrome P450 [Actinomycetota bacterium]